MEIMLRSKGLKKGAVDRCENGASSGNSLGESKYFAKDQNNAIASNEHLAIVIFISGEVKQEYNHAPSLVHPDK
jgi:hypothetical protein